MRGVVPPEGYTVNVYAIVDVGGKQERVVPGGRVRAELVGAAGGSTVELSPVLVVNDGEVLALPEEVASARVRAVVLGEVQGPKVRGFTYKPKSRSRRRYGHRQDYSALEVTEIFAWGRTFTVEDVAAVEAPVGGPGKQESVPIEVGEPSASAEATDPAEAIEPAGEAKPSKRAKPTRKAKPAGKSDSGAPTAVAKPGELAEQESGEES